MDIKIHWFALCDLIRNDPYTYILCWKRKNLKRTIRHAKQMRCSWLPLILKVHTPVFPCPGTRIARTLCGRDSVLESKGTHRLSCATLSPPAYQCFLGAQSATPCNDTAHNAKRLHDRNNDACWISTGELTDYSFGARRRGLLANSKYVYLFISNTLPSMLYLHDKFDRVILYFLTCVSETWSSHDHRW